MRHSGRAGHAPEADELTLTAEDSENSRSSRKEPRYEVGDEKTQGHLGETRELSFVSELSMESSFSSGGSSGAESLLRGAWAAVLAAGFGAAKAPERRRLRRRRYGRCGRCASVAPR